MAKPNYYDTSAAIQVIGCTILQPNLLNEDGQYFYSADDFVTEIHRVAFGAVFNLHQMGAERIAPKTIEDYLQGHPESYGIYQQSKGSEWLQNCIDTADIANFDYYYSRLKKMTLLRGYSKAGVDMTWLYDPDNLLDIEKKEQQENYLNRISLNELADIVDNKILTVRDVYVDNATDHALRIGDSVAEVLASLEETPEIGAPFADKGLNGITRGARYGKYYLRSAPTGVGKTRSMLADACYMACNAIFDPKKGEWVQKNNQPVLFISTELDVEELTTMALAFLTGYNEEDILLQRISFSDPVMVQAAQVLKESPLYLEILPDYTIKQVENTIKRNIRVNHTKVVFFDYFNSSLGLLTEVTNQTHGMAMREDIILSLLSTRLKEIANDFNVFIMSATQTNASAKTDPLPDANLLKGSKAIAEKADFGSILLPLTETDQEKLQVYAERGFPMPNIKLSVYKNRRGSFVRGYLWMQMDKSTCRYETVFATDWDYKQISITAFDIEQPVM